jgi:ankyrin repeat protein
MSKKVKQKNDSLKLRIIKKIKKKQHGGNEDLFKAVIENNIEKVISILETNNTVDVNYIEKSYGKNALYEAIQNKNFNISQLLVEAKTNVNYIYPDGKNVLYEAVDSDNFDISKLLVEAKTNVNYIYPDGQNALYEAIYWNNFDISQLLVEAKTNVNYIYPNGRNALYDAVARTRRNKIDIVKLLVNANADVNTIYDNGKTILDIAIRYSRDPNIVFTLINSGAIIKQIHNNDIDKILSNLSNENISKLSNVTLKNKIIKFRQNALKKEEKSTNIQRVFRGYKNRKPFIKNPLKKSEYCNSIKCKALEKWINENKQLIDGKNITMQKGNIFPVMNYNGKMQEWFNINNTGLKSIKRGSYMNNSLSIPGGKLEGILWYAKGDEWLFDKLVRDDFENKIGDAIFEFEIDETKIYNINDLKTIVKNKKTFKNKLNWPSLVSDPKYCGFYVNLRNILRSDINSKNTVETSNKPIENIDTSMYKTYKIFSLFDVNSGGIWDNSCITSVKLLAIYNNNKKKFENVPP